MITTSLAPSNRLFLRPTCVGTLSTRSVEVVNPGRVEAGWRWTVSKKLEGVVRLTPESGVLRGGESCEVTVSFSPNAAQAYEARTALLLLPLEGAAAAAEEDAGGNSGNSSSPDLTAAAEQQAEGTVTEAAALGKTVITIAGEGAPSAISIEPRDGVWFGPVRVGYAEQRSLTLINQSDGLLQYRIGLSEEAAADDSNGVGAGAGVGDESTPGSLAASMAAASAAADAAAEPIVLETASIGSSSSSCEWWVDEPEGVVGGRSQKALTVTLLPRHRRRCNLQLIIVDGSGSATDTTQQQAADSTASLLPPLASVAVTADASFPCVLVTDVACDSMPKPVAWQQLGLPALNLALASPVTPLELHVQALADKGVLTTDSAAALLPPLEVDLGTMGVGAGVREFAVRLFNPGELAAAWELHSYDDPEVRRWEQLFVVE